MQEDSINKIQDTIKQTSKVVNLDNLMQAKMELWDTISKFNLEAQQKEKLRAEMPQYLSQTLSEKLTIENPQTLLDLYKQNSKHDLFQNLSGHEIYKHKRIFKIVVN